MKQLLFLLLFPCLCVAQYTGNGNQKITLGEQTSADGLVWRGRLADTANLLTNKLDTSVYIVLDTGTRAMWYYRASTTPKWTRLVDSLNNLQGQLSLTTKVTGTLPVANGGTGSTSLDAADIVTKSGTQTIEGAKTFTSAVTATRFNPNSTTATGTGMFLPAANTLGFSTNSTNKLTLNSSGNLGLGVTPSAWENTYKVFQIGTVGSLYQGDVSNISFGNNLFINTSGSARYITNNYSTIQDSYNGQYRWFIAPSGTADAVITFTQAMTLKSDNELQIAGTTDKGAYNLQVNGTGVWGDAPYYSPSDANIKENIFDLDSSLNIVNNLKPISFNYINTSVNNDTKHLGFIAQDVYQILENKDYLNSIVRSDGETLSIAYSNLIPLLTKAIQEQQALIKALEQRILILENK